MSSSFKRKTLWPALALLAVLLSACSQRAPSRQDLIGVWKGRQGGVMIFRPDGRVEVRNAPVEMEFGEPRVLFSGTGTWGLKKPAGASEFLSGWEEIDLTIEAGGRLVLEDPCYATGLPTPAVLYDFVPPAFRMRPSLEFGNCDDEYGYEFEKQ